MRRKITQGHFYPDIYYDFGLKYDIFMRFIKCVCVRACCVCVEIKYCWTEQGIEMFSSTEGNVLYSGLHTRKVWDHSSIFANLQQCYLSPPSVDCSHVTLNFELCKRVCVCSVLAAYIATGSC